MSSLLSPAAIAMSREDISSAAAELDLSSDVKDFFTDVLEGAMLGAATVAQMSTSTQRDRHSGRVLFVLSGPADFDARSGISSSLRDPGFHEMAPQPVQVVPGKSAVQPLGP